MEHYLASAATIASLKSMYEIIYALHNETRGTPLPLSPR
jgi:hypothetical protein